MAIVINGTGTIAGVSATGITTAPTNATDASKLPLAGGTLTGNLQVTSDNIAIGSVAGSGAAGNTKGLTIANSAPFVRLFDNVGSGATLADYELYVFNSNFYIYDNIANAERMRISSDGKLGIGAGNNDSYDTNARNLLLASSGNTGITIRSGGSSNYAMIHFADGTSGGAQQRAGRILYEHSTDSLQIATANTIKLRIDSDGLKFGTDTAAANALDDYEEGTWTPSFNTGSPTYTTTYARTGTYTKIGNVVHVYMELYMGAISFGDATAIMEFSGLPFASKGVGNTFGMGMASSITWSSIYTNGSTYNTGSRADSAILSAQPTILASASVFRISLSGLSNTGRAYLKNAAFHNGSGMAIGFSYNTV